MRFNCTFSGMARTGGRRIERKFRIEAPDEYTAIDLLNDKHKLDKKYVFRNYVFGTKKQLAADSESARAAANAGKE